MKNWKTWFSLLAMVSTSVIAAPQSIDQVAAIVNNGVVLQSDVNSLMQSVKLNARQANQQLPDDTALRHQVLDRLILDQIQLQLAGKLGISVNDADLDGAIATIAGQNRMSVGQLQQNLQSQGINYADYREQIRKEMLATEARNSQVRSRINILPQEVDTLAKQISQQVQKGQEYNLSHIQIPLPENPTQSEVDAAQTKAEQVMRELKKGADFSKMAIANSSGPKALEGGNLGWVRPQSIPSVFAEKITNATTGTLVGPFRTGVGFHILKVNALRGEEQSVQATEVHARHILLKTSVMLSDEQAQSQLLKMRADLLAKKADFAALAKEYSQDPGSAAQGGDLGWTLPDAFVPQFRNELDSLKVDQISQPFKTPFGWHIVQLLGTKKVDRTDAAIKDRAYRMLFNMKFAEETPVWLQEQRAAAYVKVVDSSDE
ncbi:MAG: peptidylprolyl isomerase SurA [Plesiomonas sp.]